jgi:nucleoside-diphosphate-sugar epimerase
VNDIALVTGIEGFTGRYLRNALESRGFRVHGLSRFGPATPDRSVCDLNNRDQVLELVRRVNPRVVAHLAGVSHVAHADVSEIYQSNIMGTRNLLEALAAQTSPPEIVLLPSSAHVYGNAATGELDESSPLVPHNDYAISKLAVEHLARLWAEKLPVTVTRPFNYTGRGQPESFLVPKIVGYARRKDPELVLGNLDVARDFSDVRDVADCYARIIECKPAGCILNVCSGRAVELREIVSMVSALSGVQFRLDSDVRLRRENEVQRLSGSDLLLQETIGATEFRPISQTLEWMLSQQE